MTKLERCFWERLQDATKAGVFDCSWREPIKLKLAGRTFYTPDFFSHAQYTQVIGAWAFWEVKGFMRDDASVKLKVAAETYSLFSFVLVTREKRIWQCRYVTDKGISREVWCPDWLR